MHRITTGNINMNASDIPKCFPVTHNAEIDAEHVELHRLEMALMDQLRVDGPGEHLQAAAQTFLTTLQHHFAHEERALLTVLPRRQAQAHRDDHADMIASAVHLTDSICRAGTVGGVLELATLYDRIFRHIIYYDFDVLTLSHIKKSAPEG